MIRSVALGRAAIALLTVGMMTGCGAGERPAQKEIDPKLAEYVLAAVPSDVPNRSFFDFEGKVRLVGWSIDANGELAPGKSAELKLYWLATERLGAGWNLFTHLIAADGKQLKNLDNEGPLRAPGENGAQVLGPSRWEPGKVYVDTQRIEIPADARTPEVSIAVGVWRSYCARAGAGKDGKLECLSTRDARLTLIGGTSDNRDRAIITHLATGWKPPVLAGVVAPSPVPPGSAAPR